MQSEHLKGVCCFYINDYEKSGGLVFDILEDLLEHVFLDISVSFIVIKYKKSDTCNSYDKNRQNSASTLS